MADFLLAAAPPVFAVALAVFVVSVMWKVLRTYALGGPSEPLRVLDGVASPPARRRSVDWSELVLVSLILLQLGLALTSSSSFGLVNVVGLLVAVAILRSRVLSERLGGPRG